MPIKVVDMPLSDRRNEILFLALVILALGMFNCKKALPESDTIEVPGQVTFVTKNTAETEEIFSLINDIRLPVTVMHGFMTHKSLLTQDSVPFIRREILAQPYAYHGKDSTRVEIIKNPDLKIVISPRLYSIHKKEYQANWLSIEKKLKLSKLTELEGYCYFVFLEVPVGSEKQWITKLNEYKNIVKEAGPVFEYVGE